MIYEFEYDYCGWAIEVDERWLRELRRFIERFIGPLRIVVSLKVLWCIYYGEGLALLRPVLCIVWWLTFVPFVMAQSRQSWAEMLQMVSEPNTGRCVSEEVRPSKGWIVRSHIDTF